MFSLAQLGSSSTVRCFYDEALGSFGWIDGSGWKTLKAALDLLNFFIGLMSLSLFLFSFS